MFLILFHDHRTAPLEVPRRHKEHQYSKSLPTGLDLWAAEGALKKKGGGGAPLSSSRSVWLVSRWTDPSDWQTAGMQICGRKIHERAPALRASSEDSINSWGRSPRHPKVSILAPSRPSSAFALRSAAASRAAGRPWPWQRSRTHGTTEAVDLNR